MNLASSHTVYAMSGRVQVARYMHFPTMVVYGKSFPFSMSSGVAGDRRVPGSMGVVTELQAEYLKSCRMDSV